MEALFTDEQIILIIKEQEAGEKTAEVCRRHALPGRALQSKATRVGKRLRSLEDETGKPKELLAEQMLDNGREFTSIAIQKWVQDTGIDWHNIAPGKIPEERFNRNLQRQISPLSCIKTCAVRHWMNTSMQCCSGHWVTPAKRLKTSGRIATRRRPHSAMRNLSRWGFCRGRRSTKRSTAISWRMNEAYIKVLGK